MSELKRVKLFNKQAAKYYKKVNKNSFDNRLRKKLIPLAYGKVLEAAVGAGNNFPYYSSKVTSVTGFDLSPEMIEKARLSASNYYVTAELSATDAESYLFPENEYDTVVSTLSLCAYSDPQTMLKNFIKACKPGGLVLLIEHGISSNGIYSWLQKKLNNFIFRFSGCHQTRDISDLISNSGLSVEQHTVKLLGTVHIVAARKGNTLE